MGRQDGNVRDVTFMNNCDKWKESLQKITLLYIDERQIKS